MLGDATLRKLAKGAVELERVIARSPGLDRQTG